MDTMDAVLLPELFESVSSVMTEKADELCAMDAKMGDGDLGLTMRKGFGAMPEILRSIDEPDMGKKLMKAGMKMASVVPSTMGTLMASGIMTGGKGIVGSTLLDAVTYGKFLCGFAEGIEKRGKCARGDRTVLDAVAPAADAVAAAVEQNPGLMLDEAAAAAVSGAEQGVEATRSMEPKFGKAAVHKAAARDEVDQGAVAALYMLRGFAEFFKSRA